MAIRYSAESLLFLRDSPLCTKPTNLPPQEEWMGSTSLPDALRAQNNKATGDRSRNNDNSLIDQTNRRPGLDRHASRNTANPEDIVLGPPRTAFASATLRNTSNKTYENDKAAKDGESRDRFTFRSRNGDPEGDRFRDGRLNNTFRRRGDADQDSEGWSTVKPRKSFGHEGAERFHGRMGATGDRFARDDNRPRDSNDRDGLRDRPQRTFDRFAREKEGEEAESRSRNGLSRGKSEPWFKNDGNSNDNSLTTRERMDRAKSWRERDKDNGDAPEERGSGRYERRWDRDRDHRVERNPEWMDEPAGDKSGGHTEADLKKFMESMKAGKSAPGLPGSQEKAAPPEPAEKEKPKAESAPAIEAGPDKFFLAFSQNSGADVTTPGTDPDSAGKTKAGPKTSRFMSLFNAPQEDGRKLPEPQTAAPGPPLDGTGTVSQQDLEDKAGFQALLLKLRGQTLQQPTPTPPATAPAFQEPPPPAREMGLPNIMTPPEPFQQFMGDRRDDMRRGPPHQSHEILSPRPMPPNPQTIARSEQMLMADLAGPRQHGPNQGPARMDHTASRNNNNTEFLIQLMQKMPEPQPTERTVMRMNQAQRQAQMPMPMQMPMPPMQEREQDFGRERGPPQRQMRQQGPPGFMEEQFHHHPEQDNRPQQPTQILQRPPPPPGLDQMGPSNWMPGGGQLPPPQRGMMPPPGLPGGHGPSRNIPMPAMFPPNFPPGAFGPPDGMGGPPPPRNAQPPPGFFGGPPPPGFIPPPGMGGFQGGGPPGGPPDGHGFGMPFDGNRLPPGAGTGLVFRRQ